MDYLLDEHRVHLVVYHLVLTPKRRKPVLVGNVAQRCREIIEQKCSEKGWEELLKLPSFLTRSYFAATAGNVSKDIIQKYIEAQKGL